MDKKMRAGTLLTLLLIALLGAGCTPKVLDFRNVTISNGKIYEGDENEPFTGQVTNVPDTKLLGPQGGFRTLATRISQFGLKHGHLADRVLLSSSLCTAEVKDGLPHGAAICHFQGTSAKRFELAFKNGLLDGPLTYYQPSETNAVIATAEFSDGLLDGTEELFDFATKSRILGAEWSAGRQVGRQETFYSDTGALLAVSEWKDGAMDGEWVNYAPDGKGVTFRARYQAGKKSGIEEHFDPTTGNRLLYGEWKADKRDGEWKEWDASGRLRVTATWSDGVMTSVQKAENGLQSSGQLPTAATCVDSWIDAFRKEAGSEAIVRVDQIQEWETWCSEGKKPE